MTVLRKEAYELLDSISEEKLSFVIQIIRGVKGLTGEYQTEREAAFERLESLRKKGTITNDKAELASYRDMKYGK